MTNDPAEQKTTAEVSATPVPTASPNAAGQMSKATSSSKLADPVSLDPFVELARRCKAAGIAVEEKTFVSADNKKYFVIQLPSGRDVRSVTVISPDKANALLATAFEQITPLGRYEAYLDRGARCIEAGLRPLEPFGITSLLLKKLGMEMPAEGADTPTAVIQLRSTSHPEVITLQHPSATLELLRRGNLKLSLKIEGVTTERHDVALAFLERVANSLLFQIDLVLGTAMTLARARSAPRLVGHDLKQGSADDLCFPRSEYDNEAMALYWYGRSARGMPLLQYLAYYQCLEFYFPAYSRIDAQRRIRNVLKDPAFQADRDTDLGRLINAAAQSGSRGFGDERSQLRAVFQECLDAGELRTFLCRDATSKTFFGTKSKALGVNALPIEREEADIRSETANRLYDIRCKIVHTKGGNVGQEGEFDLLLPFSKEAEALDDDVALIRYVAQRVLIAASRPLKALGH